jgi:hypothetical protein
MYLFPHARRIRQRMAAGAQQRAGRRTVRRGRYPG